MAILWRKVRPAAIGGSEYLSDCGGFRIVRHTFKTRTWFYVVERRRLFVSGFRTLQACKQAAEAAMRAK